MLTSSGALVLLPLSPGRSSHGSGGQRHLSTHQDLVLLLKVTHSLLSHVAALAGKLLELGWTGVLPLRTGVVQSPGEQMAGKALSRSSPLASRRTSGQISSCARHSGLHLSKRWSHSSTGERRFEKERKGKTV